MSTLQHNSPRLHSMDAVRTLALLLGVVFHASLSFVPVFIGWAVMDINTSAWASWFVMIAHSFRMELFFLIAGYFSHLTYRKYGGRQFLKNRLFRLGVPLVCAWFVLRALLVSGWIMGAQSMRGEANISNALVAGVESLLVGEGGWFVGTHLWFLYYLILASVLILLLSRLADVGGQPGRTLKQRFTDFTHWCSHFPWSLMVLALPVTLCLWFMSRWGVDTPDKSLLPHWPVLALYTGFFGLGWMLNQTKQALGAFTQFRWRTLFIAIITSALCLSLAPFEAQPFHPQYRWLKLAYCFSYALMMWSLVILTMGICQRLFATPNRVMSYLAESAYWVYLIHLPIVVYLQVAFAELPLYWLLKLTTISVLTLLLSLLLYHAFVRNSFIGAVLNGRRQTSNRVLAESSLPKRSVSLEETR